MKHELPHSSLIISSLSPHTHAHTHTCTPQENASDEELPQSGADLRKRTLTLGRWAGELGRGQTNKGMWLIHFGAGVRQPLHRPGWHVTKSQGPMVFLETWFQPKSNSMDQGSFLVIIGWGYPGPKTSCGIKKKNQKGNSWRNNLKIRIKEEPTSLLTGKKKFTKMTLQHHLFFQACLSEQNLKKKQL